MKGTHPVSGGAQAIAEEGMPFPEGTHLSVLPCLLFFEEKTESGFLSETADSSFLMPCGKFIWWPNSA